MLYSSPDGQSQLKVCLLLPHDVIRSSKRPIWSCRSASSSLLWANQDTDWKTNSSIQNPDEESKQVCYVRTICIIIYISEVIKQVNWKVRNWRNNLLLNWLLFFMTPLCSLNSNLWVSLIICIAYLQKNKALNVLIPALADHVKEMQNNHKNTSLDIAKISHRKVANFDLVHPQFLGGICLY